MINDKTADLIAAAVGALITLAAASFASRAPAPKASPQEELQSTETPTPMSPSHAEALKRLEEMEARAARIMRQLKEMEPDKKRGAEPKLNAPRGHTSSTP
jgi:hypothetical protein